jgi:hypothetical protein
MTTDQVTALSTTQLAAMSTAQLAVLPLVPSQLLALTTAQIALLTPAQIQSIAANQIAAFTTDQVRAITTQDIAALLTSQIRAMETEDLFALTTTQVAAFTSTQAGVMTTTQVESFSVAQIAAFSTAAYRQLTPGTPIVLDLNGDGVKTVAMGAGVHFDLFADGTNVNTGWVSASDGLLVLDRNHDGRINSGSELFGSSTRLASGALAANGYEALAESDANHDGVIDQRDAVFSNLRVWVDSNSDGVTDGGELKTLDSLHIASIAVVAVTGSERDNGNLLGLTSTYQTTDGQNHDAADVWFLTDHAKPDAAAALVPTATVAGAAGLPAAAPFDASLRANVSSLAQAIGVFSAGAQGTGSVTAPGALGSALPAAVPSSGPSALALGAMVDAMRQFDANGNQVANPAVAVSLNGASSAGGLVSTAAASSGTTPLFTGIAK